MLNLPSRMTYSLTGGPDTIRVSEGSRVRQHRKVHRELHTDDKRQGRRPLLKPRQRELLTCQHCLCSCSNHPGNRDPRANRLFATSVVNQVQLLCPRAGCLVLWVGYLFVFVSSDFLCCDFLKSRHILTES